MTQAPLVQLNHVGLTVSDLDSAMHWLTGVFGFVPGSRAGRPPGLAEALTGVRGAEVEIAFLDRPGLRLELLRYRVPDLASHPLPGPADTGAVHLALTVADLAAVIAASVPHGAQVLGKVIRVPQGPNLGALVAYLRHPAGIMVELIQPAAQNAGSLEAG
jgi:catechol 2,3-dioxygenase-like lactoylglutathione lyase family enzyme